MSVFVSSVIWILLLHIIGASLSEPHSSEYSLRAFGSDDHSCACTLPFTSRVAFLNTTSSQVILLVWLVLLVYTVIYFDPVGVLLARDTHIPWIAYQFFSISVSHFATVQLTWNLFAGWRHRVAGMLTKKRKQVATVWACFYPVYSPCLFAASY